MVIFMIMRSEPQGNRIEKAVACNIENMVLVL